MTVPCKVADAYYLYNLREFPDSKRVIIKRVSKIYCDKSSNSINIFMWAKNLSSNTLSPTEPCMWIKHNFFKLRLSIIVKYINI